MLVHVDKAVAFAVLTGGEGHAVDAAPRGVAHQIHAIIRHRFDHLFHVGTQVVDTIVIVDAAVLFHFVIRAKSVFDDKQRLLVTFIQLAQGVAQAHRVDLPAPVRSFDVRVRNAAFEAGDRIARTAFRFHRVGHVVAEAQIITGAFTQDLLIARFHIDGETATLPFVQHVGWVVTTQLYVGKDIALTH